MSVIPAHPAYESVADVEAAAQKMRAFYLTGATLDVEYRRQALEKLRAYLKANEERILAALTADLGKAPFEGYATELGIVYDEIATCLKHLNSWARPRESPPHHSIPSKVYPLIRWAWCCGAQPRNHIRAAGPRADGRRHRRRQLRGAQALAHVEAHERAAHRHLGERVPTRVRVRVPRLGRDERLAAGSALGPDLLHREPERGPHRHGSGGEAPHARSAGAGRQKPLHRGRNSQREARGGGVAWGKGINCG